MLNIKREGKLLRQGLNVYSLSDRNSLGFALLLGQRVIRVRYSKNAKRWFLSSYTAEELEDPKICHHSLIPGTSPVLWKCIVCGHEYMEEKPKPEPARKPMTDAELRVLFRSTNTAEPLCEGWPGLERFARAIEKHHGIGTEK